MKKMRTMIFLCIALLAISAFALQSQQQSPSQQPPTQEVRPSTSQPAQADHPQMPSIDEQVQRLSDRINLTDDQKTKTKTILEDQHTQAVALMKDDSVSQDDKRQKIMALRQTTISKIKDMLNDDQKKKFDAYLQEMQAQRERQNAGGTPKN
jgi:ABC-type oligopeptide transport system substrate-binding subunit